MDKITEDSILPDNYVAHSKTELSWKAQYCSFPKQVRDAAAERLYNALNDKQRKQLKATGGITFKCLCGNLVTAWPRYAGTTDVGCYSFGDATNLLVHKPTTIGDFLLALKIQFSTTCLCNKGHEQVVRAMKGE